MLNHIALLSARNGTTTHTVDPASTTVSSGVNFTPTAGRLLLLFVAGPQMTTPSGWTLTSTSVNNNYLYLYRRTAAGGDTLTLVTGAGDFAMGVDLFEFSADTTYVRVAQSSNVASGAAGPSVSMTGANYAIGAAGMQNYSGNTPTCTWSSGVEQADFTAANVGVAYSSTVYPEYVGATAQFSATWTTQTATNERMMVALNAPAAAPALPPILTMQTRRAY